MAFADGGQIRVMVVDDSQEFLNVVCQWIGEQPRLQLVGTARNGQEALENLQRIPTDLVFMDAVMPVMNGFEATARLKAKPDAPKVVILSLYVSEFGGLSVGAEGFASKSDFVALIPRIIQSVFDLDCRGESSVGSCNAEPMAGTQTNTIPHA